MEAKDVRGLLDLCSGTDGTRVNISGQGNLGDSTSGMSLHLATCWECMWANWFEGNGRHL